MWSRQRPICVSSLNAGTTTSIRGRLRGAGASGEDASAMQRRVLVTGGVGYLGVATVEEMLRGGCEVSVIDALLHGQAALAAGLERSGARVLRADIRDAGARRS